MELSERKKRILKAIVETFVQTAEPVGSKAIATDIELGLSPATIRNEMAELTSLGYLEQPHTSAGRVPSPQGYRIYVNELMNEHKLSLQETQEINKALKQKMSQLDQLLSDAGKLVSELTNYPAYTLAAPPQNTVIKRFDCIYVDPNTVIAVAMLDNNTVKNKLMTFPGGIDEAFVKKLGSVFNANFTGIKSTDINATLISAVERGLSDDMGAVAALSGFAINALEEAVPKKAFVAGASHLLTQPEYKDVEKAHKLLSFITEGKDLMQLPAPVDSSGIRIMIGPENIAEELKDSGVVVASYDLGNNTQGLIGVVGPTRMDYAKVAAYLSYIAEGMKRTALGSEIKPQLEEAIHREEG